MDDTLSSTKCGTRTQYFKHHKLKEPPCGPCKEANREYHRQRAISHKDIIYAQKRAWYDARREHVREYQQAYYESNKEKVKQATSEYQKAHPEKRQKWNKAYRLAHPELLRDRALRWKKDNPEKVRESARAAQSRRKARKLGNGIGAYTEAEVIAEYGEACHICSLPIDLLAPRKSGREGWEQGLHIDHLIPLSKGGPDSIENVRPSHGLCNVRKWAN